MRIVFAVVRAGTRQGCCSNDIEVQGCSLSNHVLTSEASRKPTVPATHTHTHTRHTGAVPSVPVPLKVAQKS
eukprot:809998-Prorocentrum_minimum.AAC.1